MIKELTEMELHARYSIEGTAHVRDALMLKASLGGTPAWDDAAELLLAAVLTDGGGLESMPLFLIDIHVKQVAHTVALLALHLAGGDHGGAQILLRGTSVYRTAEFCP